MASATDRLTCSVAALNPARLAAMARRTRWASSGSGSGIQNLVELRLSWSAKATLRANTPLSPQGNPA